MRRPDDMEHDSPDDGRGDWTEKREGPSSKLIAAIVIAVVLLVFVLQNGARTQLSFLFLDGYFPLWTLIVVGAALGFAAGWLVSAARRRRRVRRQTGEGS
jgi:uncharacterized integral membrane protein